MRERWHKKERERERKRVRTTLEHNCMRSALHVLLNNSHSTSLKSVLTQLKEGETDYFPSEWVRVGEWERGKRVFRVLQSTMIPVSQAQWSFWISGFLISLTCQGTTTRFDSMTNLASTHTHAYIHMHTIIHHIYIHTIVLCMGTSTRQRVVSLYFSHLPYFSPLYHFCQTT